MTLIALLHQRLREHLVEPQCARRAGSATVEEVTSACFALASQRLRARPDCARGRCDSEFTPSPRA